MRQRDPKAISEKLKAERIQGTAGTKAPAGGKARPKRRKPRKRVS